jgi:hypothetical protein
MEKLRSLAIVMLGLACPFLIACLTGRTPTQSVGTPARFDGAPTQLDGTPTQSRATAEPQAPHPADSASQIRTARYSGVVGSVTSAQHKDRAGEAVDRLGNLSSAVGGQTIKTMRAMIYAALAAIFIVVLGATTATRVRRHRKLSPSSLNARH